MIDFYDREIVTGNLNSTGEDQFLLEFVNYSKEGDYTLLEGDSSYTSAKNATPLPSTGLTFVHSVPATLLNHANESATIHIVHGPSCTRLKSFTLQNGKRISLRTVS